MKNKKSNFSYNHLDDSQKSSLMMLIGLFIIVYSIICVTEGPGKYFRFPLTYLFGSYGIIYLIPLLFIGFYMLIKRKSFNFFNKIQYLIIGLLFFNLLILASINENNIFSFTECFDRYNNDFFTYFNNADIKGISQTGGGLIGYMMVGIINSLTNASQSKTGRVIATVIVSIIAFGLLVILVVPYIIKLVKKIKEKRSHKVKNKKPKKAKKSKKTKKSDDDTLLFTFNKDNKSSSNDSFVVEQEVTVSGNNYEYKDIKNTTTATKLNRMINEFDNEIYPTSNNASNDNQTVSSDKRVNQDIFSDVFNSSDNAYIEQKEIDNSTTTISEDVKISDDISSFVESDINVEPVVEDVPQTILNRSDEDIKQAYVEPKQAYVEQQAVAPQQTIQQAYVEQQAVAPQQTLQQAYVEQQAVAPQQTMQQAYVEQQTIAPQQTIQQAYAEQQTITPQQTVQQPINQNTIVNDNATQASPNDTTPKTQAVVDKPKLEEKPVVKLSDANYDLPPLYLLKEAADNGANARNEEHARMKADVLTNKMKELNVDAQITNYVVGPSVTRYEITLAAGVRVNTFVNLQEDFKLALGVNSIRIEAPIPGKSAIGIEVPNAARAMVSMKEIVTSLPNKHHKLYVPVGKDIGGSPISVAICDMPHCLISGATNSGKSVCANSIIVSLLMNYKPSEVRMIMVDPKRVEMLYYVDIPHLLCPIITEAPQALVALEKLCKRMMERFDTFAKVGAKNIASYNEIMVNQGKEKMPFILLFVDEFAELMLTKKASMVEERIQKLVQLGRAAGIHLILCTQRPDVNVITGTIKSNIPCRMTFRLSSLADSRTVIDLGGAEKLLNNGDMLLLTPDYTGLRRVQGVYVSDYEIANIVEHCKKQLPPQYDPEFSDLRTDEEKQQEMNLKNAMLGESTSAKDERMASDDALYEQIRAFVINSGKASTSLIQRKFAVGYSKAARMVDRLEEEGVVGPENGSKGREVYIGNNQKDKIDIEIDEEETLD